MTGPLPFPRSLRQDIQEHQLGEDPQSVYETLILAAKLVRMQLDPAPADLAQVVADDADRIARMLPTDTLPALYQKLLEALVLCHRAKL